MPRILIAGYFGFGNIGDEAVLRSMVEDLRREVPALALTVTSQRPEETAARYGVHALHWRNVAELIAAIEQSDLVLLGGGGLYNSYFSYDRQLLLTQNHSAFAPFVFGVPVLAYLAGKPCMVFGVGATRFLCPHAAQDAALSLALASCCTVRDAESKQILERLGCPAELVRVTADPAFRLENAPPPRIDKILAAEQVAVQRPLAAVVLRNWTFYGDPQRTLTEVAQAVARFIDVLGGHALCLAFDTFTQENDLGDDRTIIARFIEAVDRPGRVATLQGLYDPAEMSGILGRCDVVLAMRLHPLALAVKNRVPCIGLAYDPKVTAILARAGFSDLVVDLAEVDRVDLFRRLERSIVQRPLLQPRLDAAAEMLRAAAWGNVQTALDCLWNPPPLRALSATTLRELTQLTFKQTKLLVDAQRRLAWNDGFAVAQSQFNAGDLARAAETLKSLTAIDDRNGHANYLLAFCLHQLRSDDARALFLYDAALRSGFDEFWVRYNRGSLLLALGRREEARDDLRRAVQLNPQHAGAGQVLARAEDPPPAARSPLVLDEVALGHPATEAGAGPA